MDKRSNRCPKCSHTYTSRTHYLKCKGGNRKAWHASHNSRAGGWSTSRRTTAQIIGGMHWSIETPMTPDGGAINEVTQ